MTDKTEKRIIEIIATDRIDIPISSMSGKLKRQKPNLARAVQLLPGESFEGDRVYARLEAEDVNKARGMRDGIELFKQEYPKYGSILEGYIQENRVLRETHLYFGMNPGARLSAEDYLGVMENLGFSEGTARSLYPELMEVSRKLSRKREEERSILIG